MNQSRDRKLLEMSGEKAARLTLLPVALSFASAQVGAEMVRHGHGWGFPLLAAVAVWLMILCEITEFLSFERRLRPDGDQIADDVERLYREIANGNFSGAFGSQVLEELEAILPEDRRVGLPRRPQRPAPPGWLPNVPTEPDQRVFG